MPVFYIVAAVVIAGYIAFVVRAFKRGTLSFKGQPAPPRVAAGGGGGLIEGYAMALLTRCGGGSGMIQAA